jgi:hypothetical protein
MNKTTSVHRIMPSCYQRRPLAGPGRQNGTAWVEFIIVGTFVLVPLFTMVPMLGKYIDTSNKVEQAARYAAWERTAWFEPGSKVPKSSAASGIGKAIKSEQEIQQEVQARVLAQAGLPVHSEQKLGKSKPPISYMQHSAANGSYLPIYKEQNPPQNGGSNLYPRYVNNQDSEKKLPGVAGKLLDGVLKIGGIGGFEPNSKGLYTSTVMLQTQPLASSSRHAELSGLSLKFERSHTVLADGWSAGGREHNENMVRGLMLTSVLDNKLVDTALKWFSTVPIVKELDKLEFGHVDVDAVPEQRLGVYK